MNQDRTKDYSIIIPAYNEEEYLPETLACLKKSMNTTGNLKGEIIVSNNNSTDRTAEIAEQYGARVVFEEHRQISRARNTGAGAARGKYFIFVDSDTKISSVLLKKTLRVLESGKICGGGTIVEFDGNPDIITRLGVNFWVLLSRTFKWACGAYVFCTREAFLKTGGFDEDYYASEEIHISRALRLWGRKKGKRFVILDEPIITSNRKMRWYSKRELFIMTVKMLFSFTSLKDRKACYGMWYKRPEKDNEH